MGMMSVLTVKEAAGLLKTTQQQIRKMIHSGVIPALRVGREWRIPQDYIESFIEENLI